MTHADSKLRIPRVLQNTPSLLRLLVAGYSEETLQWRPSPERWSAAMVLAHLADAEVLCMRARLMRTATEDRPLLERYDQQAFLRASAAFPIESALATLERERATTLRLLDKLPAAVLERQCTHPDLGVLTFESLLHEFAFHDLGHIRQIAELCRSHAHYPKMGGWRNYYSVNP
jgi:hypothetical protein